MLRFWTVVVAVSAATVFAQPELIERTLAIVAGQSITLSDLRVATTLGLIDGSEPLVTSTRRLIERALVLREVQRYAPPDPSAVAIDARLADVQARFESRERFIAVLDGLGFSESQLRQWLREDLRIAAYIDQRFAAASTPGDDDVAAEYARRRAEFEKTGVTLEQATPALRDRLAADRRRELTTDWIADLRRRTPVVELVKH